MQAIDVIEEIRRLPDAAAQEVYQFLFSAEGEAERLLAAFDRLPRESRLTEAEILALPRARHSR